MKFFSGSIKSITRNPKLFFVSSTTSTSFATTRYLKFSFSKYLQLISTIPSVTFHHTRCYLAIFTIPGATNSNFHHTRCYLANTVGACKRKKRNLVSDELERWQTIFSNFKISYCVPHHIHHFLTISADIATPT